MTGRAALAATAAAVLLAGCTKEERRPDPRPLWRHTVEGIAPLMSPAQVRTALGQRGYRQVRCTEDQPLYPDPMNSGDALPCFASASRHVRVSLYFLDLTEGRRLAVANFRAVLPDGVSDAARLESSRRLARYLRANLGPPLTAQRGSVFTSFYWSVQRDPPSLPDLINTTVGEDFEANVTMTSFWAYGNVREGGGDKRPPQTADTGGSRG